MSIIHSGVLEADTVKKAHAALEPYFKILPERTGVHAVTMRRKRIDAILVPRKTITSQSFPKIPVGLEIKATDLVDGRKKQVIELMRQAVDYRLTRFEMSSGMHFLPLILIYPNAAHYTQDEKRDFAAGFQYCVTRILGKFAIGELFLFLDGFKILLCGQDYYIFRNGKGRRWNMNWGFEKFEENKKYILEKFSSAGKRKKELNKIVDMIGI